MKEPERLIAVLRIHIGILFHPRLIFLLQICNVILRQRKCRQELRILHVAGIHQTADILCNHDGIGKSHRRQENSKHRQQTNGDVKGEILSKIPFKCMLI